MENPLQTETQQVSSDSSIAGTEQTHDTIDTAGHHSDSPDINPDKQTPEVTHSESEALLNAEETQPVTDPPYLTRSGRPSKPPQRLICDPVWSLKASVLLSLVNSQNQELLQNVFQNWLYC